MKDDGRRKQESERMREMFERKAKEKRWKGEGGKRSRVVRPTFGGWGIHEGRLEK